MSYDSWGLYDDVQYYLDTYKNAGRLFVYRLRPEPRPRQQC